MPGSAKVWGIDSTPRYDFVGSRERAPRATFPAMMDPAEAGFCRSASLAIAAPLAAPATSPTEVWIVLEYRGAWASKAWDAAEMPAAVRARVDAFVAGHPRARIQLVRHVESRDRAQPELVLASSR